MFFFFKKVIKKSDKYYIKKKKYKEHLLHYMSPKGEAQNNGPMQGTSYI